MDLRIEGTSRSPFMYILYLLCAVFLVTNWLLLRHSAEEPEKYSLYYHEFYLCVFNGGVVLIGVGIFKVASKKPTSAVASYGTVEYCEACETFVSEHSYHCQVCSQCTLHMRTHCIWLNTCLGLRNYKSFLHLLLYTSVTGLVFLYLTAAYIWGGRAPDYLQSVSLKLLVYFHCFSGVLMWGNAIHLVVIHSLLVINNMALIDLSHGGKLARVPCACKDFVPVNDFDMGTVANLRNSLGRDVMMWGLPTEADVWVQETEEIKVPDVSTS